MGLSKLILETVKKYPKGLEKRCQSLVNGNGNVRKTKDQLFKKDQSIFYSIKLILDKVIWIALFNQKNRPKISLFFMAS
jgi:hypothetical protein